MNILLKLTKFITSFEVDYSVEADRLIKVSNANKKV